MKARTRTSTDLRPNRKMYLKRMLSYGLMRCVENCAIAIVFLIGSGLGQNRPNYIDHGSRVTDQTALFTKFWRISLSGLFPWMRLRTRKRGRQRGDLAKPRNERISIFHWNRRRWRVSIAMHVLSCAPTSFETSCGKMWDVRVLRFHIMVGCHYWKLGA